jgi:hypothetical protein
MASRIGGRIGDAGSEHKNCTTRSNPAPQPEQRAEANVGSRPSHPIHPYPLHTIHDVHPSAETVESGSLACCCYCCHHPAIHSFHPFSIQARVPASPSHGPLINLITYPLLLPSSSHTDTPHHSIPTPPSNPTTGPWTCTLPLSFLRPLIWSHPSDYHLRLPFEDRSSRTRVGVGCR